MNSRRRFLAMVSGAALSLPLSAFSSTKEKLPRCQDGEIKKDSWEIRWKVLSGEITTVLRSSVKISPNKLAKFGYLDKEDILSSLPSKHEEEIFDPYIEFDIDENIYKFKLNRLPSYISFSASDEKSFTYWKVRHYSHTIPMLEEHQNSSLTKNLVGNKENIRDLTFTVFLTKGSKKLNVSDLEKYDKKTNHTYYEITESQFDDFFLDSEDGHQLTLQVYIESTLLIEKTYNLDGFAKDYNKSLKILNYEKNRKESKQCEPGCFISTAVCEHIGLTDDCWELRSLRKYRDEVLSHEEEGSVLIERYYAAAPSIVAAIQASKHSKKILNSLYWRYILPCSVLVRLKLYSQSKKRYKRMIEILKHV